MKMSQIPLATLAFPVLKKIFLVMYILQNLFYLRNTIWLEIIWYSDLFFVQTSVKGYLDEPYFGKA